MKTIDPVVAGTLRMATSFVVYAAVVLPLVGGLGVFSVVALAHQLLARGRRLGRAERRLYLTYYAANHLVGASRAMPLNSLYAVWAIVFSVVLVGLHPTAQLVVGVLISFAGAVMVVSGGTRTEAQPAESEAVPTSS